MQTQIKLLDPQKDERQWLELIAALPKNCQDVFLLPGYAKVFGDLYQAGSGLFYCRAADAWGISVYLSRPIRALPFYSDFQEQREIYDIISAEFSGPLVVCGQNSRKEFLGLFLREFNSFCNARAIVAEFGRLNPYYNNNPDTLEALSARLNRRIVCLGLAKGEKEIWQGFSKGNKSSIKKAKREGVHIKRVASQECLKDFYRLYVSTMRRNEADEFYYFSLEFFENLFGRLKENISLFAASFEGRIISAGIFLHCGEYMHYYFSGSDETYLRLCPNNLLLYEAICWAKSEGFKVFNLGGGFHNGGDDSLFAFKSSFSSQRVEFYTYSRIHDQKIYDTLCKAHAKFNKIEFSSIEQDAYFPLYRK
jgi:hypothetical protein